MQTIETNRPCVNCRKAPFEASRARETVLHDALLLSPGDRALLVDALEVSLDHGEFATPDIAADWSAEIDRRLAAYDRGETKAIDFD